MSVFSLRKDMISWMPVIASSVCEDYEKIKPDEFLDFH